MSVSTCVGAPVNLSPAVIDKGTAPPIAPTTGIASLDYETFTVKWAPAPAAPHRGARPPHPAPFMTGSQILVPPPKAFSEWRAAETKEAKVNPTAGVVVTQCLGGDVSAATGVAAFLCETVQARRVLVLFEPAGFGGDRSDPAVPSQWVHDALTEASDKKAPQRTFTVVSCDQAATHVRVSDDGARLLLTGRQLALTVSTTDTAFFKPNVFTAFPELSAAAMGEAPAANGAVPPHSITLQGPKAVLLHVAFVGSASSPRGFTAGSFVAISADGFVRIAVAPTHGAQGNAAGWRTLKVSLGHQWRYLAPVDVLSIAAATAGTPAAAVQPKAAPHPALQCCIDSNCATAFLALGARCLRVALPSAEVGAAVPLSRRSGSADNLAGSVLGGGPPPMQAADHRSVQRAGRQSIAVAAPLAMPRRHEPAAAAAEDHARAAPPLAPLSPLRHQSSVHFEAGGVADATESEDPTDRLVRMCTGRTHTDEDVLAGKPPHITTLAPGTVVTSCAFAAGSAAVVCAVHRPRPLTPTLYPGGVDEAKHLALAPATGDHWSTRFLARLEKTKQPAAVQRHAARTAGPTAPHETALVAVRVDGAVSDLPRPASLFALIPSATFGVDLATTAVYVLPETLPTAGGALPEPFPTSASIPGLAAGAALLAPAALATATGLGHGRPSTVLVVAPGVGAQRLHVAADWAAVPPPHGAALRATVELQHFAEASRPGAADAVAAASASSDPAVFEVGAEKAPTLPIIGPSAGGVDEAPGLVVQPAAQIFRESATLVAASLSAMTHPSAAVPGATAATSPLVFGWANAPDDATADGFPMYGAKGFKETIQGILVAKQGAARQVAMAAAQMNVTLAAAQCCAPALAPSAASFPAATTVPDAPTDLPPLPTDAMLSCAAPAAALAAAVGSTGAVSSMATATQCPYIADTCFAMIPAIGEADPRVHELRAELTASTSPTLQDVVAMVRELNEDGRKTVEVYGPEEEAHDRLQALEAAVQQSKEKGEMAPPHDVLHELAVRVCFRRGPSDAAALLAPYTESHETVRAVHTEMRDMAAALAAQS